MLCSAPLLVLAQQLKLSGHSGGTRSARMGVRQYYLMPASKEQCQVDFESIILESVHWNWSANQIVFSMVFSVQLERCWLHPCLQMKCVLVVILIQLEKAMLDLFLHFNLVDWRAASWADMYIILNKAWESVRSRKALHWWNFFFLNVFFFKVNY